MPWYLQQITQGSWAIVPNQYVERIVSAQIPAWLQPAICAQ
jgi:hypothetical protein